MSTEPFTDEALENHWKLVSSAKFHSTLRLKVPGGWLYWHKVANDQSHMIFILEPEGPHDV